MISLVVKNKQAVANNIVMFELIHSNHAESVQFTPGSHMTVQTPGGLNRCYSICSLAGEATIKLAVKIEEKGRGGSRSMGHELEPGGVISALDISNNFPLVSAKDYLFIAGGIGITPIISMISHLKKNKIENFKLIYLTRNEAETAFLQELKLLCRTDQLISHFDEGEFEKMLDLWPFLESPTDAHIYCCGPQPLMDSVKDMTGHWDSSQIHYESFGAKQDLGLIDTEFDVIIKSTGQRVRIGSDENILQALKKANVSVKSSCESGTCGTCKVRYEQGTVDHRDLVLRPDEKADQIMICVSRSKSTELLLDL
jgi:phthalate 4,5-dioxygenase reductase subunit